MVFMNLDGSEQGYGVLQPVLNLLNGGPASWANLTGIDDDSNPAVTIKNSGSGGALSVLASGGSSLLTASDSGVTIPTLSVTTLTATTSNVTTLNVSGNTALGDGNADTITLIGLTTFRNAANTATQLYVDAGNNRVIVGSATTLGTDTTPNLQVQGRLYVAPDVASDQAIQIRRSAADTAGWWIGTTAASDSSLTFKDDAGTTVLTLGDASTGTYQLDVASDARIQDDLTVVGDVSAGRGVLGGTTFSGSEELRVVGQSRLEGQLVVTTGGVDVTGSSTFNTATAFSGSIDVNGGALITNITVDGSGTPLTFSGSSQTATTVGAAGAASALPATPSGYLKITVGATDYKIPYYAA